MGARADFYLGRDPKTMRYIGSVAWDGYPSGVASNPRRPDGLRLLASANREEYLRSLGVFLAQCEDASLAIKHGWPWPWKTSAGTDYTYAFDDGQVWVSCFGRPWYSPLKDGKPCERDDDEYMDKEKMLFPDMTDIQNVTLGARSGLIVF